MTDMTVLPLRPAPLGDRAVTRRAASRLAFPLLVAGLLACVAGYATVALVVLRTALDLLG